MVNCSVTSANNKVRTIVLQNEFLTCMLELGYKLRLVGAKSKQGTCFVQVFLDAPHQTSGPSDVAAFTTLALSERVCWM